MEFLENLKDRDLKNEEDTERKRTTMINGDVWFMSPVLG